MEEIYDSKLYLETLFKKAKLLIAQYHIINYLSVLRFILKTSF